MYHLWLASGISFLSLQIMLETAPWTHACKDTARE